MSFDVMTLMTVIVLHTSILSAILFAVDRAMPQSVRGTRDLAWAFGLYALAGVLFPLRPYIPETLRYVVFNAPAVSGSLLMVRGLRRLAGSRPHDGVSLAVALAVLAMIEAFTLVWPDYPSRVFTVLSLEVGTSVAALATLWRARASVGRTAAAISSAAFVANAFAAVRRCWHMWTVLPRPLDLEHELGREGYLLAHSVALVLLGLGLLLAVTQRMRREVERSAETDPLTGLLNRGAFQLRVKAELARSKRRGRGPALALFDIDHFKGSNDRFGHLAGDEVLRNAASLLTTAFREEDVIARFGGEEFMVLLLETRAEGARLAAERADALLRVTPSEWRGRTVRYTASVGVACWKGPEEGLESLFERADRAMYRAKAAGRDAVVVDGDATPPATARPLVLGPLPFAT